MEIIAVYCENNTEHGLSVYTTRLLNVEFGGTYNYRLALNR
jgi:hypothetical protein